MDTQFQFVDSLVLVKRLRSLAKSRKICCRDISAVVSRESRCAKGCSTWQLLRIEGRRSQGVDLIGLPSIHVWRGGVYLAVCGNEGGSSCQRPILGGAT